jgi:DNA invertase Pin-like site-specific DNA recombinase
MYKDETKLDRYPREFWEESINRWVFDELARKAIIRNFLDGVSYETIAEELDVSRDTVYNKIKKYSPKLFNHVD